MSNLPDNYRFREIIAKLQEHQVQFIIIGGVAESLMGSPRVTYDLDICYERTQTNVAQLSKALRDLEASLRGVPAGLPIKLDARTLWNGMNFTLQTRVADLDILGYVEPIGDFSKLLPTVERAAVGESEVQTISLANLIAIKTHLKRQKDRESLTQLLAIKRIRDEKPAGS